MERGELCHDRFIVLLSPEENESEAKYQTAIAQLRHDAQLSWQIFGSFLVAHSLFLAFLLHALVGQQQIVAPSIEVSFVALAGFLLGFLWLASHGRSSAYYHLRMAQAKYAEPSGRNLLKEDGENFSKGERVSIGGVPHPRMPYLSRVLSTRYSAPLLIKIFMLIYLIILIRYLPWW